MADENAIEVKHLGKRYTLGRQIQGYNTLSETITRATRSLIKRLQRQSPSGERTGTFWALEDVSFEVKRGEVVGIIGRNGAGKSTLLKILSRITTPTEGTAHINGRVGSLLEVGTGFHPELTGRENIFLSGSIMGMKKAEIEEKFDQIVQFAEIEQFLDTPVKRYSSGMYVRLAFAVAAHLEPEILIVDEVLAVGDAEFQKKCLGKMGDVAEGGRTVLFVSHNMTAIKQLCPSCIYLDGGRIREIGESNIIVERYLAASSSENPTPAIQVDEKKDFQLTRIRIIDGAGRENTDCNCDYPILVEMMFKAKKRIPGLYGYLTINRTDGTIVMESDSFDSEPNSLDDLNPGDHCFHVQIPTRTLGPGNYQIYLNFSSNYNISSFDVDSPGIVYSFMVFDETSSRGNRRGGYFSTKLKWEKCNIY